jgi:hypothetical protein
MPSSVIRSFAYDAADETLVIVFTSGRRYRYHGVPSATHRAMTDAFAKGEFFNKAIKDHYRFTPED